jgi:hypothetical protein
MIQGYPDRPSVHPGEMLILHVSGSSNGATFRVDFYLQDAGLIRQPEQLLDQVSHQAMPGVREADWNWPSYPFQVPEGWQSGAYIAVLYEFDAAGNALNAPDVTTADGYDSKVLFVVKNAAPANPILLKLSLSTYHAYNGEGGGGLYDRCGTLVDGQCTEWISTVAAGSGTDADGVTRTGLKVTLRRPGGGTGGRPIWFEKFVDTYDQNSPPSTFEHYEAHFIRWFRGKQYQADYCTDLDIDQDAAFLAGYQLLVSIGHDEYWSARMRSNVDAFVKGGGNVAFFSGNICYWRSYFVDGDTAMVVDKPPDQWNLTGTPENMLTGVSSINGGMWYYDQWSNPGGRPGQRPAIDYRVQNHDHWVYENAQLADGDGFGGPERLIGYECDGAPFQPIGNGGVVPALGQDTPPGLVILGFAQLHGDGTYDWTPYPGSRGGSMVNGQLVYAATMALHSTGTGTVFTGATIDWPRVIDNGSAKVETITRNVLDRLSRPGFYSEIRTVQLANYAGVIRVGGFYSDDDGYRHALINTTDGDLHEIFYNPGTGQGDAVLSTVGTLSGLAGFYSGDDHYRHAIAALPDQTVHEIFYNPDTGQGDALLAHYDTILGVGVFFSPDDHYRHAIVALANGEVHEIFYNPDTGQGDAVLAQYSGVLAVAGFYSDDDRFRHAIIATDDGEVHEIFYNPDTGQGDTVVAHLPGIVAIGGFYSPDDTYRHVLIATIDGVVREVAFHPRLGTIWARLGQFDGLAGVAGFYSPDDRFNHAIVGTQSGDVFEIFYRR